MRQINEHEIEISGKKIVFDISIKKIIEFEDIFIVLIRERKEVPNNIIAYNNNGVEIWKVNDIVKAKISRGYYDIEKMTESCFKAYYELGIVYEINIETMSVIKETYMR